METTVKKRLISRVEYYRMGEVGILQHQEKVELINGEIFIKRPVSVRHAAVVTELTRPLVLAFMEEAIVSNKNPIHLDEYNDPVPDLALLRFQSDFYLSAHPRATDLWLIIEVSDASYEFDATTKLSIYASSGIPVYWIIDLRRNRIEVYENPQNAQYQDLKIYLPGDRISFKAISLDVNEILLIGEV